jgi:hypothetical protein
VTRSTDPNTGEISYTFEVTKEGGGCGLSHVVGYFDPQIDGEEECEDGECEPELYDLILDPSCVDVNGGPGLAWSIVNPNNFSVQANWSLNGANGSGSLAPGSNFVGNTPGPGTATLSVNWDFGSASMTSPVLCPPTTRKPPATDDPTPTTFIENLVIPVTGADLGLQALLPTGGLLLVGISFLMKGLVGKHKNK